MTALAASQKRPRCCMILPFILFLHSNGGARTLTTPPSRAVDSTVTSLSQRRLVAGIARKALPREGAHTKEEELSRFLDAGLLSASGKCMVFHYTSWEAARAISESEHFRVSRDVTNDAHFGPALYVTVLSGEEYTPEQIAEMNFGDVTSEGLHKSQCYFVIIVDRSRLETGVTGDRAVVMLRPMGWPHSTEGAAVRFEELDQVVGPCETTRTPRKQLKQQHRQQSQQRRQQSQQQQQQHEEQPDFSEAVKQAIRDELPATIKDLKDGKREKAFRRIFVGVHQAGWNCGLKKALGPEGHLFADICNKTVYESFRQGLDD